MDDSVLSKAKQRLLAVEREAEDLRAFITMYEMLSETKARALEGESERFSAWRHHTNRKFYGGSGVVSSSDEIVAAARDVLKQVYPRPLPIGDLFRALLDRGIKISGQNPKGNLSAKLAPPKDIVYVKDEGWYYRPQKIEAPDYEPGEEQSEASCNATRAEGREAVPGGWSMIIR